MSESQPGSQPEPNKHPASTNDYHSAIDWAALHEELVGSGDTEGAELLDQLLASPRRGPDPTYWRMKHPNGQGDREFVLEPLTDERILNALNRRRQTRDLRAELQPALEAARSTLPDICGKWEKLAAWATRFAHTRGGEEVIDFGEHVRAARLFPQSLREQYPPDLAWARAFRESTAALLPFVIEAKLDDVDLHRLLQSLDRVLAGEAVVLTEHIRDFELLVRSVAARAETRPPTRDATQNVDQISGPARGDSPRFDKVERAILLLMRDGGDRRSMRAYAAEVGVYHTTLGRDARWRRAWDAATPEAAELPAGQKDEDGNIDAWIAEVCENCRVEAIARSVTVAGELVRACEACAEKLVPRTNPRNSS